MSSSKPLIFMPMLVLAGGFGSRISAVVKDVPKPLAPVAGKPHLFHMIMLWKAQGLRDFIFLLHHKAGLIITFLEELRDTGLLDGCSTKVVVEDVPLGTGGAVANAVSRCDLAGEFLVVNADTWLDRGPLELTKSCGASICVVNMADTRRYGRVELYGGRIGKFVEKSEGSGPGYVNAGMYKLDAGLFHDWDGRAFSLETDILTSLAVNGQLSAVKVDANFIDMGVPDDYVRFQRWIEGGMCKAI